MRKAIEEQAKGKLSVVVYPVDKWVLMMLKATGAVNVRNLGDVRWLATEDGSKEKGRAATSRRLFFCPTQSSQTRRESASQPNRLYDY